MCVHISICISLSLYIYIYIHVCMCVYRYVYIYIYIYTHMSYNIMPRSSRAAWASSSAGAARPCGPSRIRAKTRHGKTLWHNSL